jgi:hypothetical protein
MKNTSTEIMIIKKTKDSLVPMMSDEMETKLAELSDELEETYKKRQVWRTQTEMMFSVLDDGKYPTPASKYWQCVREQSVFYEQLVLLSFKHRQNNIAILELEEKLEGDDLNKYERMTLEVDMDSAIWAREGLQIEAKDRMRELELWSKIKTALVEGNPEFDTEDVNVHQAESYLKRMENRRETLTAGSGQSEVINVLGPLNTLRRLCDLPQIPFKESMKEINNHDINKIPLSRR